ncbi:MAG: hypothetical protein KGN04_02670 [Chloroflexi bacterium]|nr:hypothetical protein [Chloroflexota bacterium]
MKPIGRIRSTSGNLFRRSNGRRLSGIGAAGVVLGAIPAWWTLAAPGVPPTVGNAFDTYGAVGFFVALGTLFLLIAPDAFGEQLRFDQWPVHVGLVGTAMLGFIATLIGAAITATGYDLPLSVVFGIDRAPGLWITMVALGVWVSGVAQIVDARDDR